MEDSSDVFFRQRVTAIAEYDYIAKENDEIDLLKGQIIQNIIQKPGGWWEGTISSTGKRGMFPDNFVRVIETTEGSIIVSNREQSSVAHRQCKAIYSYARVNDDELTLAVGDVIDFLEEVEEGWWKGKLHNKVGLFPSNFVVIMPSAQIYPSQRPNSSKDIKPTKNEILKDTTLKKINKISLEENTCNNNVIDMVSNDNVIDSRVPDLPPRPVKEFCRVEFPYTPQNDDELELVVGRIITIVDKELPDKGWWKGTINGKTGVFPDNFVKLLPSNDIDIPAPRSNSTNLETTKISNNSNIPSLYPGNGLKSIDSTETTTHQSSKKTTNQTATKQAKNMIIELITQSSTSSERSNRNSLRTEDHKPTNLQNTDETKQPPPLPTKKPIIPGKKSLQTAENIKQKVGGSLSQSVTDGGHSSKFHMEKTNNLNDNLSKDTDFDKVQRVPILSDMRAGRVKAPKRRPPTVSTSLMTESIIKNLDLNTNIEEVVFGSETLVSSCSEDQLIKPRVDDLADHKVPWIDEFKTRQVKLKPIPNVEPRKTINMNNESKTEDIKSTISVITNVSTKIINTEGEKTVSKEKVSTKTSPSFNQLSTSSSSLSSSIDKNIERESERTKPELTVKKESIRNKFEEIRESKIVHSNINVIQTKTEGTATEEEPDSGNQEETTIIKLEHRVRKLEANVQMQQEMIENLMKMLQNESNRVELLKNQLDKYAQCVTQV